MSRDSIYLAHVLDAIDRIADFAPASKEQFLGDLKTQDAIVRNLEVLGEAVKNMSAEVRAANDDVPWRDIAGMRDKMIHEYFGVDMDLVWDVISNDLPELRPKIERVATSLKE